MPGMHAAAHPGPEIVTHAKAAAAKGLLVLEQQVSLGLRDGAGIQCRLHLVGIALLLRAQVFPERAPGSDEIGLILRQLATFHGLRQRRSLGLVNGSLQIVHR